MDDNAIVDLYWNRNEAAIKETDNKYRRYLFTIAYNILHDEHECEECLNDTYLGAWNSIPPHRPAVFIAFISKIMRRIAINRYRNKSRAKRIPSEFTVALSELEECFDFDIEEYFDEQEIVNIINSYLRSSNKRRRYIFVSRFYCADSISDIASALQVSESTVYKELAQIKRGLKELLEEEGFEYERD